jgi:tetratricopeptide (TPR) repeat protein
MRSMLIFAYRPIHTVGRHARSVFVCAVVGWLLAQPGCVRPSGDTYAERGIRHFENKEYNEAIDDLKRAVELGLKHIALDDVCTIIGNCYNELENYSESIFWHKRALDANPQAYKAWVNLGIVHRLQGDYDDAEESYRQAIEVNPDYAEAYASLGALYIFRDDLDQAIPTLERAVKLDDTVAVSHANLSLAYAMDGRYEEAHRTLKAAIVRGYENGDIIRERIESLEANEP